MELTKSTAAYVATLSDKATEEGALSEKEAFLLLSVEEQNAIVSEIEAMGVGSGAELMTAKAELENLPIYAVDGAKGTFVLLKLVDDQVAKIPVGKKIFGRLLGTRFVHSKEHKENWKKTKAADGTIRYSNSYFVFENMKTGLKFGVWNMAGLRILEKVVTSESLGDSTGKNPEVAIEYVGLIEGRDKLQKDYGIILTEGNSSHVFDVVVEKGAIINQYEAGCMNPLNDPEPFVSSGEKKDKVEATKERFAQIAARNGGATTTPAIAQ